MKSFAKTITVAMISVCIMTAGCKKRSKAFVEVAYTEKPALGLPEGLHTIAFIPFTQAIEDEAGIYTAREKKWGDVIVSSIAEKMQYYARKYDIPLKIIEREAVATIMKEKDLADAGLAEENKALQLGKLSKAQAICFGKVVIDIQTVSGKAKTVSFKKTSSGLVPKTEYKKRIKRTITVAATVKLVATATDKSILTFNKRYSNTIDLKPSALLGSDASAADLSPEDDVIMTLITRIVDDFVAQLMPHEVHRRIPLAKVKSKSAKSAVKLARVGDYDEAISLLKDAIELKPQDHGAVYNLGVMYEVKNQLEKALKYYKRAYSIKDKDLYLTAILRVKRLLKKREQQEN